MKKKSIEDKLFLLNYKHQNTPHIRLIDNTVCDTACSTKICTIVCPAKSYEKTTEGAMKFNHENCLECGSCRIVCPKQNVAWSYPVAGTGVAFRYG
jgi:ferredoxin like protein